MKTKRSPFQPMSVLIQVAVIVLIAHFTFLAADDDTFTWRGPDGVILPFESPEAVEQFLASARVVEVQGIDMGVTHPKRLLLEKDGVRMHAVFRNLDEFKGVWQGPSGVKPNFHDSCYYELAAYRLSRLLAIDRVPPVVERAFVREDFVKAKDFGRLGKVSKGTVQAWVEGAMTEIERRKHRTRPPNMMKWLDECQTMFLWNSLTFNDDPNLGNLLIGPDWKIWLIDSTRSFRPYKELRSPEAIKRCDPRIWEKLRNLDPEILRRELSDILSKPVLDCLIARQQALVEFIRGLIGQVGEEFVVRRLGR